MNEMMRAVAVNVAGVEAIAYRLLDKFGRLRLLKAFEYDDFASDDLRAFCHYHARYLLPTFELVEWLEDKINAQVAIEIGSGCGDLGRPLGIPMTDNRCQEWPDVKKMYEISQQPVIKYSTEVHKHDALDAVAHYQPDVVIASWVTKWIDPNLPPPPGGGSVYGVKESELIKRVKTYIHIGSKYVHNNKDILQIPHKTYEFPWLRSRRTDNVIYVWEQ